MSFSHLSCDQLAYWLEMQPGEVNVIDIRDRASYEQGHIAGAEHIDNNNVEEYIAKTNTDHPLVVCCYHGNSSQGAAEFMSTRGFKEAFSLDGGFEEWQRHPFHSSGEQ